MTAYLDHLPDYHDPAIATAFDAVSLWAARFGLLLLAHIPVAPTAVILDLVCGTGFPLFELAHMMGPSARLVGVDVWRAGLERAAIKRAAYGLDNVDLRWMDGQTIPCADVAFDLIVANLVLNNAADPPALLRECARVAKPQGRLVLTSNPTGHMQEFYAHFRAVLMEMGLERHLDRLAAHEAHRGSCESVCGLVEHAGFAVERVIEEQGRLRYASGSALLRDFLTRVGFLSGWRQVVEPHEERAVFTALEERLNATARREGELSVTIPMLYVEAVRDGGC